MLSKQTEKILDFIVSDDEIGDEISARLISVTPKNPGQALAILKILNTDQRMIDEISNRLITSLGRHANGACGKEISDKVNGCVEVLRVYANGGDIEEAKNKMGCNPMGKIAFKSLTSAMENQESAEEFRQAYDKMIITIQSIK